MRMMILTAVTALVATACNKTDASGAGAAEPARAEPGAEEAPVRGDGRATASSAVSSEAEAVLHVEGMVCQGCAEAARDCLQKVDGVTRVETSFQDGTARVRYETGKVTTEALASALQAVDRGAAPPFRVTSVEAAE